MCEVNCFLYHFNGTHFYVLKIDVVILYLIVCSVHLRKLNKGSQYGPRENSTAHTVTSEPQSRHIPSQRLFTKPNCLNPTTQPSLPSREWTICSAKLCVCVCVCVSVLAKFVPLSGGPLHVSGLQRAASHSESILFDCRSLDLHVKQLLMLETEGKGG